MSKQFTHEKLGYTLDLGTYAKQADGSAWIQHGGTVVLATVVTQASKEFPGFLPLTVDYREQFAAVGRIPGGYFKREGKFTDKEILTARLVDRTIRPLFPERYFNQVQIYIQLFSYDQKHSPAPLAMVATSIALGLSKIPFMGPVGGIEVVRLDGKWKANPVQEERLASDVRLFVAGNSEGICMVEGAANQISEKDLVDALFIGHAAVKEQVAWQEEVIKQYGAAPKEMDVPVLDWDVWEKRIDEYLTQERVRSVFKANKIERGEAMKKLREEFIAPHKEQVESEEISESFIDYLFDTRIKPKMTDLVFADGKRIDGRAYDQVRPVETKVGLLPFTHGSALFMRGGTQALASATLGSAQDELRTEELVANNNDKAFILHYNFPPFSVGEVRPMRGVSRRDVGHGNLAATALMPVLPAKEGFPYTIRVVADILESDGSSSMATVCSSTMALMDTGIQISSMVSGVAMGLLQSSKGQFQAITDISGFEDAFGLMDFKVAGTAAGVTAIQMDIKYKDGLPRPVFEQALEQARRGREHILGEMQKVLKAPRAEMSPLVPKYVSFMINTDKIGAVIGTGGKVIREIIEKTKTTIDVGETGKIVIFGTPDADIVRAEHWVKVLAGQINSGDRFLGTINRIAEFGLFVELVPGQTGLLHVSAIPRDKQNTMARDYPIGMQINVKVLEYDSESGRIRLAFDTQAPKSEQK